MSEATTDLFERGTDIDDSFYNVDALRIKLESGKDIEVSNVEEAKKMITQKIESITPLRREGTNNDSLMSIAGPLKNDHEQRVVFRGGITKTSDEIFEALAA